jgi:hypothetical protein
MADDIEIVGPQATSGLRVAAFDTPNFPPNYSAGSAELAFTSDIITDPADDDDNDPTRGYGSPGTRVSEV